RDLEAQHADAALVGDRLRGQHLHRGRLPGPVRAEEPQADPRGDLQVEPVHGGEVAEALDDAAETDGGPPLVLLTGGLDPDTLHRHDPHSTEAGCRSPNGFPGGGRTLPEVNL